MGPPPHQVIGEVEDDVPAAAVRRPLRPPHARTRRARNKIQAKEVRVSELGESWDMGLRWNFCGSCSLFANFSLFLFLTRRRPLACRRAVAGIHAAEAEGEGRRRSGERDGQDAGCEEQENFGLISRQ